MRFSRFGFAGALAVSLFATGAFAEGSDWVRPGSRPSCVANPKFRVVDVSFPIVGIEAPSGRSALEELKGFGVETIFRYYDHENETLPGKTLLPAESDAIIKAGMKIGVVFQHNNDNPVKFMDSTAGTADAKRALFLADQNKQPFGSAIYFGIDGPELHLSPLVREYKRNNGQPMSDERKEELRRSGSEGKQVVARYPGFLARGPTAFNVSDLGRVTPAMMRPLIKSYFDLIAAQFADYKSRNGGKTYNIGMYCTAGMCSFGEKSRFADYFWLSPEGRNDPIFDTYLNGSSRLSLVQHLPTSCVGWKPVRDNQTFEMDFNQVKAMRPDFGQWSAKRQ